ncbi:hypothetical protein Ddc_24398 [Ditylenchus destructor]|nr:hypothetical protein Ddc_24398 [Ditylenchus destructor]
MPPSMRTPVRPSARRCGGSFELVAVDADGRPVRLRLREGRERRQGVSAAVESELPYRPLGDPPAVAS